MLKKLFLDDNCKTLLRISLLRFFIAVLCLAGTASADDAYYFDSLTEIESWGLFKDENTCWIATQASEASETNLNSEEQVLYVTFFSGSRAPKISFYLPKCCSGEISAKTKGEVTSLVRLEEDYFYPDDKRGDEKLLMNFLSSSDVQLISSEHEKPIVTFSLFGIREAYNKISRTCEFHPLKFLKDADSVYKG